MVCLDCGGAGHYNKIKTGQFVLVQSEGFSGQALDSITVLGQLDIAFCYRQTQPRTLHAIGCGQYGQILIRRSGCGFENMPEGARCRDAARTRKPVRRLRQAINQTLRRLRPFARRALMTRRPPGVFMRARKPWVRTRLILLGWYVLFMS